jgi:hypothetical protein
MDNPTLPKCVISTPDVGDKVSFTCTLTETDAARIDTRADAVSLARGCINQLGAQLLLADVWGFPGKFE